jgi:DNA helicase HerA-like ATPase
MNRPAAAEATAVASPPKRVSPESERRAEATIGAQQLTATRLGRIVSVDGAKAVAVLDHTTGGPRVEIGATVIVPTPQASVVGVVSAVSMPLPDIATDNININLMELNLAGEIAIDERRACLAFRRGVSSLPTIGDIAYLADHEALTLAYSHPGLATIEVGTLYQNPTVPAQLLVDELFGKHFLVVGTTGCGKSSALTCIVQSVLPGFRYARVVVLDIHNEYDGAFGPQCEMIDPATLKLPFWLLNFQELTAAFTTADENRNVEIEILSDAVVWAKRRYSDSATGRLRRAIEGATVTVETPVPFRLSDIVAYIDDQLGKLDRTRDTFSYKRLKTRIETLVSDPRYSFMFGSLTIEDTMVDVLGRIFRVPVEDKPITVLKLATVPPEILDIVISVISRLAFDLAVWSEGRLPVLIVCEEAHRYAPADSNDRFMPTRLALARLAKEGRKYGVSLALITQRPSELDPTIMSQCSTVVAMRLSTERDQHVVRANTHEGALDLLDFLPLLGDREAIVLGQGVIMPMRIKFRNLANRSVTQTGHMSFSRAWQLSEIDRALLDSVVARWRMPSRNKGPFPG